MAAAGHGRNEILGMVNREERAPGGYLHCFLRGNRRLYREPLAQRALMDTERGDWLHFKLLLPNRLHPSLQRQTASSLAKHVPPAPPSSCRALALRPADIRGSGVLLRKNPTLVISRAGIRPQRAQPLAPRRGSEHLPVHIIARVPRSGLARRSSGDTYAFFFHP